MAISCNNKTAWGKMLYFNWPLDGDMILLLSALSHPFTLHALHLYATLPVSIFWVTLTEWDNCSFGIHARAHVNRETV